MSSRTLTTEAVVLRSIRFGEADCVLHLFTLEKGRVGAIAKGVRKTRSRFGARLEPFSHVELLLHEGRGDLHTVPGRPARPLPRPLPHRPLPAGGRPHRARGGAEALRRGGRAAARVPRAHALPRPPRRRRGRAAGPALARAARPLLPAEAPVARRLPAASRGLCRVRGREAARRASPPRAGGAVCADCSSESLGHLRGRVPRASGRCSSSRSPACGRPGSTTRAPRNACA